MVSKRGYSRLPRRLIAGTGQEPEVAGDEPRQRCIFLSAALMLRNASRFDPDQNKLRVASHL